MSLNWVISPGDYCNFTGNAVPQMLAFPPHGGCGGVGLSLIRMGLCPLCAVTLGFFAKWISPKGALTYDHVVFGLCSRAGVDWKRLLCIITFLFSTIEF